MYRIMHRLVALAVVLVTLLTGCSLANAFNHSPQFALPVYVSSLALTRVSGADMPQTMKYAIGGTDLLIPYRLENGSTGYLGGDSFEEANPDGLHSGVGWRSPVLLRSSDMPTYGKPLEFDSAAGLRGEGFAPAIMPNGQRSNGEYTVIPTDGISFPETGEHIVSYMSIKEWSSDTLDPAWTTNYAGLAWSPDGNMFHRIGPRWRETTEHDSPFQVMSIQRDGDFVYIVSVQAGRRPSPDGSMMLIRVPWHRMLESSAYECWQENETWGDNCQPILKGAFGEPSLRLLSDGTWALSYLDVTTPQCATIVTHTASSPEGRWSEAKKQLDCTKLPRLYGGYIHHLSTKKRLVLMVSTFQPNYRYDVSMFFGSL